MFALYFVFHKLDYKTIVFQCSNALFYCFLNHCLFCETGNVFAFSLHFCLFYEMVATSTSSFAHLSFWTWTTLCIKVLWNSKPFRFLKLFEVNLWFHNKEQVKNTKHTWGMLYWNILSLWVDLNRYRVSAF